MMNYIKEIIILVIQLVMFYIFPLFAGPTDAMGMVLLIILATLLLSFLLGIMSKNKIKYVYPVISALLFIPSVWIYYNESALIHSLWYLVISSFGLLIGIIIDIIIRKKLWEQLTKGWVKNILYVMLGIISLIIIDFMCVLIINKPLLAVKEDNGDSVDIIYRGIFYDTVICHETMKAKIIFKGFSYSCSYNGGSYILEDKTKEIKDFACAEALESFYEDDNNIYYWDCIKNKYMIVKYNDGYEETISDALNQGHIDINVLDKFGINYIKENKNLNINKKIEVLKKDKYDTIKYNKYLEKENRIIYLAGNIDEVYYIDIDTKVKLKDYIMKSYQTIEDAINHLTNTMNILGELNDGGTKIYNSKNEDIVIIKCNTVFGNRNIYIGDNSTILDSSYMCK